MLLEGLKFSSSSWLFVFEINVRINNDLITFKEFYNDIFIFKQP